MVKMVLKCIYSTKLVQAQALTFISIYICLNRCFKRDRIRSERKTSANYAGGATSVKLVIHITAESI